MFNRIKIENELRNSNNQGFYEKQYHKALNENPEAFSWNIEKLMEFFKQHPAVEASLDSRLEYMHTLEDFFELCNDYEITVIMLRWLVFYF